MVKKLFIKGQAEQSVRKIAIFIAASSGGFAVLFVAWLEGFANSRMLQTLLILASAVGITSLPLQIRYPAAFGHYGRMFYHVTGGPFLAYVAVQSRETALALLLSLLITFGSLAVFESAGLDSIFSGAKTQYLINNRTVTGPTHYQSGTYWVIGSLIALALFELPTAIASILIFTLGDGVAGLAGGQLRKRLLGTYVKGVEGTFAFFATASITSSFLVNLPVAIASSAVGAIVESLRLPIDDNITVPIAVALTMTFLRGLGL